MKRKFLSIFIATVVASSLIFGCNSKMESNNTPNTTEEQITEEQITNEETMDNNNSTPNTDNNESLDNSNKNSTTPPTTSSNESTPKNEETPKPATPKSTPTPAPSTPKTPSETPSTPNSTTPPTQTDGDYLASVEQEIFRMVNEERAKAGVPQLSYNNVMEKYARIKSKDMGDRNYFAHENPEGQLITAQMQKDGVKYNAWGENIAYISGRAEGAASQIMNMWMNSEGHRKNILSTNFQSIGVGVSNHNGKIYATQEFYR